MYQGKSDLCYLLPVTDVLLHCNERELTDNVSSRLHIH